MNLTKNICKNVPTKTSISKNHNFTLNKGKTPTNTTITKEKLNLTKNICKNVPTKTSITNYDNWNYRRL